VFDAATEILRQVVQTYVHVFGPLHGSNVVSSSFPTVDFHSGSQRLAVGTGEGALIMYDLKTATRLYVLEGHRRRLSACSFSPDGRRLVTASVDEGTALVWKVGSSFSSFFNPGAPPKQGNGGGEPFKTLPCVVPDAGMLTVTKVDVHGSLN
jgi:WD40 repeat protein